MAHYLELDAASAAAAEGQPDGSGNAARLPHYSLPQAAAALSLPERTLRAMVTRGEVAALRTDRGHYRIAAAVVDQVRQDAAAERLLTGNGKRQAAAERQEAASGSDVRHAAHGLEEENAFLRARLVAAEEREREHMSAMADMRAAIATLTESLAREQQRRMPWQPCSPGPEPVCPVGHMPRRRWWQVWRGRPRT